MTEEEFLALKPQVDKIVQTINSISRKYERLSEDPNASSNKAAILIHQVGKEVSMLYAEKLEAVESYKKLAIQRQKFDALLSKAEEKDKEVDRLKERYNDELTEIKSKRTDLQRRIDQVKVGSDIISMFDQMSLNIQNLRASDETIAEYQHAASVAKQVVEQKEQEIVTMKLFNNARLKETQAHEKKAREAKAELESCRKEVERLFRTLQEAGRPKSKTEHFPKTEENLHIEPKELLDLRSSLQALTAAVQGFGSLPVNCRDCENKEKDKSVLRLRNQTLQSDLTAAKLKVEDLEGKAKRAEDNLKEKRIELNNYRLTWEMLKSTSDINLKTVIEQKTEIQHLRQEHHDKYWRSVNQSQKEIQKVREDRKFLIDGQQAELDALREKLKKEHDIAVASLQEIHQQELSDQEAKLREKWEKERSISNIEQLSLRPRTSSHEIQGPFDEESESSTMTHELNSRRTFDTKRRRMDFENSPESKANQAWYTHSMAIMRIMTSMVHQDGDTKRIKEMAVYEIARCFASEKALDRFEGYISSEKKANGWYCLQDITTQGIERISTIQEKVPCRLCEVDTDACVQVREIHGVVRFRLVYPDELN